MRDFQIRRSCRTFRRAVLGTALADDLGGVINRHEERREEKERAEEHEHERLIKFAEIMIQFAEIISARIGRLLELVVS